MVRVPITRVNTSFDRKDKMAPEPNIEILRRIGRLEEMALLQAEETLAGILRPRLLLRLQDCSDEIEMALEEDQAVTRVSHNPNGRRKEVR